MNKHMKSYLTVVGIKLVEKMIVTTATKLSEKSGMKVEDIKEDLTTGFKIKGEKNIFFDIKSMITHLGNKKINLEDITLVVIRQIDEKIENNKLRRVDKSEIKGNFKLDLNALTYETLQLLSKLKATPSNGTEQLLTESNVVSSTVTPEIRNGEDGHIEILIDEEISTTSDNNDDTNISLEELGEHVVEEPTLQETDIPEEEKSSFISKANNASKRTIGKVTTEISDYFEIIDNLKRGAKIRLIAEKCNLSRDYISEGQYQEGVESNVHYMRNQHKQTIQEDRMLELVHIYQGRKYINTIGKTEMLDFLKLISTQGKITIEEIKSINTIKNEFEPKKSWA